MWCQYQREIWPSVGTPMGGSRQRRPPSLTQAVVRRQGRTPPAPTQPQPPDVVAMRRGSTSPVASRPHLPEANLSNPRMCPPTRGDRLARDRAGKAPAQAFRPTKGQERGHVLFLLNRETWRGSAPTRRL